MAMKNAVKQSRETLDLQIDAELEGQRLDRALASMSEQFSRSLAKEAILAGDVTLAGQVVTDPRRSVAAGELLQVALQAQAEQEQPGKEPGQLDIVFEDEHLLVIAKQPGVVVHPARGHRSGTIADAVAVYSASAASLPRCGIVHRLDKDTSGLMVVAKTTKARLSLIKQFKDHSAGRTYLAIVHGSPPRTGAVDRPLRRDPANRLRMAVLPDGKESLTRYWLLDRCPGFALLACKLESGRTHQIRVHLEHAGHPVAGDRLYRRHARAEKALFPRQMLHAHKLQLAHPDSGQTCDYETQLPADFANALEQLGMKYVRT